MKQTKSFNLETELIEKIEKFQKEHNLKSRSAALERMLLDREDNNEYDKEKIKGIVIEVLKEYNLDNKNQNIVKKDSLDIENNNDNDLIEENENKNIGNSIESVLSQMPD